MDLFVKALFIQTFLFLLPSSFYEIFDGLELNSIPFNQSIKFIKIPQKETFSIIIHGENSRKTYTGHNLAAKRPYMVNFLHSFIFNEKSFESN